MKETCSNRRLEESAFNKYVNTFFFIQNNWPFHTVRVQVAISGNRSGPGKNKNQTLNRSIYRLKIKPLLHSKTLHKKNLRLFLLILLQTILCKVCKVNKILSIAKNVGLWCIAGMVKVSYLYCFEKSRICPLQSILYVRLRFHKNIMSNWSLNKVRRHV